MPGVKKETRDETTVAPRDSLNVYRSIPVTETEVEFCDI